MLYPEQDAPDRGRIAGKPPGQFFPHGGGVDIILPIVLDQPHERAVIQRLVKHILGPNRPLEKQAPGIAVVRYRLQELRRIGADIPEDVLRRVPGEDPPQILLILLLRGGPETRYRVDTCGTLLVGDRSGQPAIR